MAPYLITATALELTYFTTLLELSFDFWVFFILQKYSFPTFSFISKFLNLSAFNAPKYLYLSPSSIFFMTSPFGSYIFPAFSFFHAIPSPNSLLSQFSKIILSIISNWSFVPLDFLWHLFCSFYNKYISYKRYVIGLNLLKSIPFSLFFMISAALTVVNKSGVSYISRQNCNCTATHSWQDINAVHLVQEPSSSSLF